MSSEDSLSKEADSPSPEVSENETPLNETPLTDQPETALQQTSEAETADSAEQLAPERRLRLKPTVGQESAKAVPSLSPTARPATPTGGTDASGEPASDQSAPQSAEKPAPPAEPVEIPPEIGTLDADIESQIEAAMSVESTTTVSGVISQDGDDSESPEAKPLEEDLEEGTKLTGKIQSIHGDDIFFDLGYRSPGVVSGRQFEAGKKPEIGQIMEVRVNSVDQNEGLILLSLPKGTRRARGNWEEIAVGDTAECMVVKSNKGGLEVNVGSIRAFMPSSQVELGFVSDLETYVGKKLTVKVLEANSKKRNLVVSHRAFLMIEREEIGKELWKTLEVGQQFTGTVKTIKDYGAFIDLGGLDGFLHIGEISWSRIKHPSEVLKEGMQIDVSVLSIDKEKNRISLGMRQLIPNPWAAATVNYPTGTAVSGRVTRIANFGAFVELEPGLEGMVHISELDYKRVKHVSDMLKVDQQIDFKVLEVSPERQRISLSLKALKEKPEDKRDIPEDAPRRKPKGPLKGGKGGVGPSGGAGGLFGNPTDFK